MTTIKLKPDATGAPSVGISEWLGATWEWDMKMKPCPTCKTTGIQTNGWPCWRCEGKGEYPIAVLRAVHVPHIVGGQARESDERCPAPTGSEAECK